jgi:hypothetical protein
VAPKWRGWRVLEQIGERSGERVDVDDRRSEPFVSFDAGDFDRVSTWVVETGAQLFFAEPRLIANRQSRESLL